MRLHSVHRPQFQRSGGIDGYQNVLTMLLVCGCLWLAMAPLRARPSRFLRGDYSAPAYLGALLVSAVLSRLPLFLALLPNPDEGNLIVGARKLLQDPIFREAGGAAKPPIKVRIDPEVETLVWPNGADFDPATLHDWPVQKQAFGELARRWQPVPDSNVSPAA